MYRLFILPLIFVLGACASGRIQTLTTQDYPPTPLSQDVKVYVNVLERPHIPLARIDSRSMLEPTSEEKRQLLRELTAAARDLGADAVMDVRQLSVRTRGMTPDETTPFPSFRQGDRKRLFYRGIAVKFSDAPSTEPLTLPDAIRRDPTGDVEDPEPPGPPSPRVFI